MKSSGLLPPEFRVLEWSNSVSIQYAGHVLGLFGAEVTKVDSATPLYDTEHHVLSQTFSIYDKEKISVKLDDLVSLKDFSAVLTHGRDLDNVLQMLSEREESTLVICLRMGRAANRSIGFGEGALASAEAGVTWAIGEPGRAPLAMPMFTADSLIGSVVAGALLGAVLKGRTGTVDVDGVEVLASFADQNSTSYRLSGVGWRRDGRRAPGSAGVYPYGVYRCADGDVVLLGRSRRDWREIAQAIGAGNVYERFPDPFVIATTYADEVDALLSPYLMSYTKEGVMELAESAGVLAAPVATLREVLGYEHLGEERQFWSDRDGVRLPTTPVVVRR